MSGRVLDMKSYTCPNCGQLVAEAFTTSAQEPFIHTDPLIGIMLWGAYSAPRTIHCQGPDYIHFTLGKDIGRLVFLCREDDPSLIYEAERIYEADAACMFEDFYDEEEEESLWAIRQDDEEKDAYEEFFAAVPVSQEDIDDLPF